MSGNGKLWRKFWYLYLPGIMLLLFSLLFGKPGDQMTDGFLLRKVTDAFSLNTALYFLLAWHYRLGKHGPIKIGADGLPLKPETEADRGTEKTVLRPEYRITRNLLAWSAVATLLCLAGWWFFL